MTMALRDSLTSAKKHHARDDCDEYYTGEALAHRLIDHCEAIGARKIVLPCDTDASRIAIYARERAAAGAFDDVAVYDDFETALDTVDESYHIVTNPPFSKLACMIFPRIVDWRAGFTLVAPMTSLKYKALRVSGAYPAVHVFIPPTVERYFDTTEGIRKIGNVIIMSTRASYILPLRDAHQVPVDDMPLTRRGYRLSTVKMPYYPYDVEHDIALPLTSMAYNIGDDGYDIVGIDENDFIDDKAIFAKIIWRYKRAADAIVGAMEGR